MNMIQVETVKRHDGATIDCIRGVGAVGGLVAELDRLKAENEKLRGLLMEVLDNHQVISLDALRKIRQALTSGGEDDKG